MLEIVYLLLCLRFLMSIADIFVLQLFLHGFVYLSLRVTVSLAEQFFDKTYCTSIKKDTKRTITPPGAILGEALLGTPTTVQALNYLEHTTLVTIDYWLYFFITLGIDEASERGRAI